MSVQHWAAPSSIEDVPRLRRGVVAFAAAHGMAPGPLADLSIAVSEILANVARHGRADRESDRLDVRVEIDDDVVVVIRGAGVGLSQRVNGPAARLGLITVASLARNLRVTPTAEGGREVSMTFPRAIAPAAAAPSAPGVEAPG